MAGRSILHHITLSDTLSFLANTESFCVFNDTASSFRAISRCRILFHYRYLLSIYSANVIPFQLHCYPTRYPLLRPSRKFYRKAYDANPTNAIDGCGDDRVFRAEDDSLNPHARFQLKLLPALVLFQSFRVSLSTSSQVCLCDIGSSRV